MKPVLFLIFNRPDTTQKVFDEIRKAKPEKLYIAADAPRTENEKTICLQTRAIIDQVNWNCEVKTLFRENNLGCQKAISSAIDWFFKHEELGIILEDDCVPSSSFFSFCSELLDRYKKDSRIMMISGNNFQDGQWHGNGSYYFSQTLKISGWATWRRAWNQIDLEMAQIKDFRTLSAIDEVFADENVALAWRLAFAYTRFKKVNSWAYPWIYTLFVQNGLSITPNKNLVTNIGFGANSTHTTNIHSKFANVPAEELNDLIHPSSIYLNKAADQYEYRALNYYPMKKKMNLKYRWKRMRRTRRFQIKINTLYK